ncbi:hypothetical protein EVAR_91702_1 [Eumeta japonica]|uniref:Uncharacterized protein n=1 Tax=Eumeta variegata TaxID=151549 RepID=A0A4C2AFH9_EUMVA|nr:hypothetical protein EVAR_91702_1 [Eumeta japonica]
MRSGAGFFSQKKNLIPDLETKSTSEGLSINRLTTNSGHYDINCSAIRPTGPYKLYGGPNYGELRRNTDTEIKFYEFPREKDLKPVDDYRIGCRLQTQQFVAAVSRATGVSDSPAEKLYVLYECTSQGESPDDPLPFYDPATFLHQLLPYSSAHSFFHQISCYEFIFQPKSWVLLPAVSNTNMTMTNWNIVSIALEEIDTHNLNSISDDLVTMDETDSAIRALTNYIKALIRNNSWVVFGELGSLKDILSCVRIAESQTPSPISSECIYHCSEESGPHKSSNVT